MHQPQNHLHSCCRVRARRQMEQRRGRSKLSSRRHRAPLRPRRTRQAHRCKTLPTLRREASAAAPRPSIASELDYLPRNVSTFPFHPLLCGIRYHRNPVCGGYHSFPRLRQKTSGPVHAMQMRVLLLHPHVAITRAAATRTPRKSQPLMLNTYDLCTHWTLASNAQRS